jgi:prepilin-type N-terminal cleavage/methylation domain-containing protein
MLKFKGFTLIELMIACAVIGILLASLFGVVTGNSPIQTKQSCMNAGGKWSEGIQYGRLTQLCTYN